MTGRRVTVIGLGLIGASLGSALRNEGDIVRGLDTDSVAMRTALERDLVDEVTDNLVTAVADATLVILAIPVLSIIEVLPRIDALTPPHTVILDVGSVKTPVISAMERVPGAFRMIGGHPIAGKEAAGPTAAEPSLFQQRSFALVPNSATDEATVHAATAMVRAVGGVPLVLSAHEHDAMVARTSHLPQMLSMALALSLQCGDEALAGPGLRDMTRLAASAASMWNDILVSNAENITAALTICTSHLENLARLAQDGNRASLEQSMLRANDRSARISGTVPQ